MAKKAASKATTSGLGAKSIPAIYQFGTPEDIANRDATGYRRNPTTHNSHFNQIQPQSTGLDANRPATPTKSGNLKFTGDPS